ncbi:MAG: exodeoxyribonuclease VII large subunit [Arcobacter butzleri]|jgi:exodeoxyribonuclease VII large subunit|nr:exodeoxyribonuclease VII large subunit [Arcobacteraceae bacterium]MDY0364802.1 exodeoxyribonuclease VII large subunit [Arcobacteraceae bacterium]NLO16850.1 exodeoxyribonuclease VII large subunit [Aliarcobacter butzleri]
MNNSLSLLSVSQLNNQIKSLLESTFISVYVEGEISNLTIHNSGHIYFTIKDKDSNLSCVLFKGNSYNLKFKLEVGLKVTISGAISVYTPRGSYQLICSKIEPSGIGSLALAYEQLKKKLQGLGYFDLKHKRHLPKYPKTIAIVTSQTGAAIEDMKKIAANRWPLCKLILIPTLVQGENAKYDIVDSIKYADSLNVDIMIVGRGGGSIEDLWAFNEEIVCEAIFQASTPIISAVGHESDFLLSDLVADIRASTPSNAIELSLPSKNDLLFYLEELILSINQNFSNLLMQKNILLERLSLQFKQNSIDIKLEKIENDIITLKNNFYTTLENKILLKEKELQVLLENFILNNPKNRIKKGYVQVFRKQEIISLSDINIEDIIELSDAQIHLKVKVIEKNSLI